MNKIQIHRPRKPAAYDVDYAQWSAEQGEALREGRFADLDRENLAEEIESLGRSDKREIENRLKVLLVHLLKHQFQPGKVKPGWKSTVREQRTQIQKLIKESPSLKPHPGRVLAEEYGNARADAADETELPLSTFPEKCPYRLDDVLDPTFYPSQSTDPY